MKKLTISFIISLFIASNTFAAPLMPNIADYRAPIDMENSSSKAWAGYGANNFCYFFKKKYIDRTL